MAVKTITIDMEAYTLLAAEKSGKESFSRVIKRKLRPVHTADNLLRNLNKIELSDSTLDRTEEIIRSRRESIASSPVIEEE
ncbi:MAG: antitoxin VapB family protein [Candidatus Erginobacter occultus]|nr:antitoxin VapB family protein [Candidatus Erginobacter occultus]